MKITIIFILVVQCILVVSGIECTNRGESTSTLTPQATHLPTTISTPTPVPDPTPPKLGGGEKLPVSYQYTRTWSANEETIVMHVYIKDDKARVDWNLYEPPPGKNEKIKYINDGEYKWLYDVDEHWASKYQSSHMVHQIEEHMLWFTENYYGAVSQEEIISMMRIACTTNQLCSNVAITGHATINEQFCTQFTYFAHDGSTIHYWISNDGYLVRIESIYVSGYCVTMEYTDIELDVYISDDKFDIKKMAPGAIIVEMTAS